MKKLGKKQGLIVVVGVIVLLIILIIFVGIGFALGTPIASVTIDSQKLLYESKQEGSWQIKKSAKWISKGKARITLEFTSTIKPRNEYTDVILVLDTSGSMNENRLSKMKSQSISLVNDLIPKGSKIALITFSDDSTILSDLTTDSNLLIDNINSLTALGNTNYYHALINVDTVLKNYKTESNRDCVVLFLTDGLPNINTPNEVGQYKYLKDIYPFLTINGVQYEMGDTVVSSIKDISDNQFIANTNNLDKFLYRASTSPIGYEKLEIADFINTDYFNISDSSDIIVDYGNVKLVDNKVIWDLTNLKSGIDAKATIDIKLNSDLLGIGGIYDTNEKLVVDYKIGDTAAAETSSKTPVLADNYRVIYDGNAPNGCSVRNVPSSAKVSVFDAVTVSDESPTCEGYEFKGWKFETGDVSKINENIFVMPEKDVKLKAEWAKLDLSKAMNGEISKAQTLYQMMADNSVPDNITSEFVTSSTGIDFTTISSDENGKGIYRAVKFEGENTPIYYYRGDVNNNNVIFGDFCWKIVRTTETKGIKLIYNGKIKEVVSIDALEQDKYINVSNDTDYPYAYNVSTNEWASTNKDNSKTGTITFNISVPGSYVISYNVSSEANYDKAMFYKNDVLLGTYSGLASGIISLGEIDNTSIIKVEYSKDSSGSSGTDTVTFSVGKTVGEAKKICNNTGTDSQIGSGSFNFVSNSLAYNGYMYGSVYSYKKLNTSIAGLDGRTLSSKSSMGTTNYKYASSVMYDEETGKYSLVDGENRVWNDTYATGTMGNQFLYTCFSETEETCAEVYYIVQSSSSLSTSYVTLKGGEKVDGILNRELVYGNDVTYDEKTEIYTLVDTITSKIGDWEKDRTNIGNRYHYTCLNETGTCKTVKYISEIKSAYTRNYGTMSYVELDSGVNIEEAVKQMTTESAHTTNSSIKTRVDNWYRDNMLEFDLKIEDTPYCNDRVISKYGSWDKDSPLGELTYQKHIDIWTLYKPVLTCRNKSDAYTVDDTVNGNGDLIYKTGLLTADEIKYAGGARENRSYYLYTGRYWWSMSPNTFDNTYAHNYSVYPEGNLSNTGVDYYGGGVRPAISLVPGVRAIEGDGTSEAPFIVR